MHALNRHLSNHEMPPPPQLRRFDAGHFIRQPETEEIYMLHIPDKERYGTGP
jgi:hypothetical protein